MAEISIPSAAGGCGAGTETHAHSRERKHYTQGRGQQEWHGGEAAVNKPRQQTCELELKRVKKRL